MLSYFTPGVGNGLNAKPPTLKYIKEVLLSKIVGL